jgi:hypothetical protein
MQKRDDDLIKGLVWLFIVLRRCTEESKIHEKLRATAWDAFCQLPGRLLTNVGLFFKIDAVERMIFKGWGGAIDVAGKDVQLVFTRGTKVQSPDFGFDLLCLGSWDELGIGTMHNGSVAEYADGVMVDSVDVCVTVLETVPALEGKVHG